MVEPVKYIAVIIDKILKPTSHISICEKNLRRLAFQIGKLRHYKAIQITIARFA